MELIGSFELVGPYEATGSPELISSFEAIHSLELVESFEELGLICISQAVSFFCEYLIILAQRGKNRSGD